MTGEFAFFESLIDTLLAPEERVRRPRKPRGAPAAPARPAAAPRPSGRAPA